jgi:lipopolysaccharide transport system permease protein
LRRVIQPTSLGETALGTQRPRDTASNFLAVVFHLAKHELDSIHRMTVLGWAWPILRQTAQLLILTFIFGDVLDLHIPHFPVYVFSGLLAWNWFAGGISAGAMSLLDNRHLLNQPRLNYAVLPIVAVAVPFVDLLVALPLLLVLGAAEGGIRATALFLPLLVLLQLVIMAGASWLLSVATIYFRDVPNIIAIVLQALFYATPVFYRLHNIAPKYSRILGLNPMATIVDGYRAVLLGEPSPSVWKYLYALAVGVILTAIGYLAFRRYSPTVIDNL